MDVVIGNIPTLILLVTILANYFDLRAKRLGYDAALLSLKEKQLTDAHSALARNPQVHEELPMVEVDSVSTPDEFC